MELKEFFRQRESVVFTLMFPVILLVVFGAVLDYDIGSGVSFTQYFMAGIIAAGILGASLQNMAISIATERSDGTLKGLAGTPMPKSAYFVGKVVQVLAVTRADRGRSCWPIGALVYDVDLPSGVDWLTFAWVTALGSAACTLLGHRGLQPGEERPVGVGDGHPDRAGPAVHLRRLLPVQPGPDLDADDRRVLPAQVDGPGAAVGLPARRRWPRRSRRARGSSAGSRWCSALWCVVGLVLCVAHLPLAGPRSGLSYVSPRCLHR